MAALVRQVAVFSDAQFDATVNSYIAQGFVVANRTPSAATMLKRKEFNILWAIIGFFLCLLPLLIYAIVYATQKDEMVEIRILDPQQAGVAQPTAVRLSPDGRFWWDGGAWQDTESSAPPDATRSPDGHYWWDGSRWRPVPGLLTG